MLKFIGKLGCLQDDWRAIRTDSWCHIVKREILKRGQERELPALGAFLQERGEALKPGIGRLCAVDLAHKVEKIFRQVKHQKCFLSHVHMIEMMKISRGGAMRRRDGLCPKRGKMGRACLCAYSSQCAACGANTPAG